MNKVTIILLSALLLVGCQMKVEPIIEAGVDECEHCSMIIPSVDNGAVAIDNIESLHTFCNPVCLILEWNKQKSGQVDMVWQNYLFSHKAMVPLKAEQAVIAQGDFRTAMGYGLLAFETVDQADKFMVEFDGHVINWNQLRMQYESADMIIELSVKSTDEQETYVAQKNDIVEFICENNTATEETIKLTGYEFELNVQPNTIGKGTFIADKPGQGFVFMNNDDEILGTMFVAGDHTTEEALYK
jgi:hypothetical protein